VKKRIGAKLGVERGGKDITITEQYPIAPLKEADNRDRIVNRLQPRSPDKLNLMFAQIIDDRYRCLKRFPLGSVKIAVRSQGNRSQGSLGTRRVCRGNNLGCEKDRSGAHPKNGPRLTKRRKRLK
jgi:hypothetical protein